MKTNKSVKESSRANDPQGEGTRITGASEIDWKPRGDEYHWDHADGCFIEKDFQGTKTIFVLYNDQCVRLGGGKTLTGVFDLHRLLQHAPEHEAGAKQ